MNTSAKGRRNEYRSKRLLEAMGYVVVRAAASRGVFDLWGISRTEIILCQVKSGQWPNEVEIEDIRQFPVPANARKVVHRWLGRRRFPDIREF